MALIDLVLRAATDAQEREEKCVELLHLWLQYPYLSDEERMTVASQTEKLLKSIGYGRSNKA